MWLVLCDSTDASARWAHDGLRRRGLDPVELVTSDDLAHARWSHHLDGAARVTVGLRDGRVLRSETVRGTLNRLLFPPSGDLMLIRPADRGYVTAERMAIFMGWLGALGGAVLNPPSPQCLCGRPRSLAEWLSLAGKAGLPAPRYRISSDEALPPPSLTVRIPDFPSDPTTVFVAGDRVVGAPANADACRNLATLARAPLLALEFTRDGQLAGVNGLPDLRLGGEPLVDALAATMGAGR